MDSIRRVNRDEIEKRKKEIKPGVCERTEDKHEDQPKNRFTHENWL
jgi:hypothetical protein